jgi:mono/diheme cytochrome c family protein
MKTLRILLGLAVIALIVAGAAVWIIRGPGPLAFADGAKVQLADYRGANPTGAPASLAKAGAVERGEYLARAADCMVCHTAAGGKEYAGGLGFKLPFGTLYSTNITADKETGIGNYSDQDFLNAVQHGKRRDGAMLYPAMPYTSYTYLSDDDTLAIKAYLFSLPPVRAAAPENTLTFPFNQRWAMWFWSTVFSPNTRYMPDTSKTPEWNRGAYLAEALAHCGECHTPRNWFGAMDQSRFLGGNPDGPDGKRVPNITSDKKTGIGNWSEDDIVKVLTDGHTPDFDEVGYSMAEVVKSTAKLSEEDRRAIAVFLKATPPVSSPLRK